MWVSPSKMSWERGSIQPRLKAPVRFENLRTNELRKYGLTGIVIDDVDDRMWLVHACSLWFQLTKKELEIWEGRAVFGS